MPRPVVDIQEVTAYRLSLQEGHNSTLATFTFDRDVQAFSINHLGVSPDTGIVIDSLYKNVENLAMRSVLDISQITVADARKIDASVVITTQIDAFVLTSEGANRINVYGQGLDGLWTLYAG